MTRRLTDKLAALKRTFTEEAMTPGQAAHAVGVTYATAQRWYDRWSDESWQSLESRLLASLEA